MKHDEFRGDIREKGHESFQLTPNRFFEDISRETTQVTTVFLDLHQATKQFCWSQMDQDEPLISKFHVDFVQQIQTDGVRDTTDTETNHAGDMMIKIPHSLSWIRWIHCSNINFLQKLLH